MRAEDAGDVSRPDALGPGGCSVEVYSRLPVGGDLALIRLVAAPHASILDLGSGAGRLSNPLAELGYHVTAVDSSAEMLTYVVGAQTVCQYLDKLDLRCQFDIVLLASNLINTPDKEHRHELLACVSRHLAHNGYGLVQWLPPTFFDQQTSGGQRQFTLGDFQVIVDCLAVDDGVLDAVVTYVNDEGSWPHPFKAQRISIDELRTAAESVCLQVDAVGDAAGTWLLLTTSPDHDAPVEDHAS
jgi:SAM-dependent methyltransferase